MARTTARTQTATDNADAARLAEQLGSLPLALEQASAYINRNRLRLAAYLEKWQKERQTLLNWSNQRLMKYPDSVAVTWKRTFDDVSPSAQTVLLLNAFFAPDNIPVAMLESQPELLHEARALHTGTREETNIDLADAIAELDEYSLIGRIGDFISVHKMVQEVMRSWMAEDARSQWNHIALDVVNEYPPGDPAPSDVRSWPIWEPLRPHAQKVIEHGERAGADERLSILANNLGQYLYARALYAEAEPLMRRALEIDEASLGSGHPRVAIDLNNLALLLKATNRLSEAEPMMRRALEIFQISLGGDHPHTVKVANNLARLMAELNAQGEDVSEAVN